MPLPLLTMKHPEIPGETAQTTQQAFDSIHQAKGWELVDDETIEAAAEAVDKPLEELKQDELKAVMDAENIPVPPGRPTNAELVTAIREFRAEKGV